VTGSSHPAEPIFQWQVFVVFQVTLLGEVDSSLKHKELNVDVVKMICSIHCCEISSDFVKSVTSCFEPA
jgi:hypothetical protein